MRSITAGKWTASQNRSAADRLGVVQGLARQGGDRSLGMAVLVGR
jgi:predicted FMN-binding regulatory protein PaiB